MSTNQLNKFTNYWAIACFLTIIVAVIIYVWGPVKVSNIGSIQFAKELDVFNSEMEESTATIRNHLYFDFVFIVVYSILFYLAYRVFQSSMRIGVIRFVVILCVVPGIFDIAENILIFLLLDKPNDNLFSMFWLAVRAKWTVAIPFAITNVMIFIYYIIKVINSFVK